MLARSKRAAWRVMSSTIASPPGAWSTQSKKSASTAPRMPAAAKGAPERRSAGRPAGMPIAAAAIALATQVR